MEISVSKREKRVIFVTLLCPVSQPAGLVWASWSGCTVHFCELAIIPTPDTEQIAHGIALLFAGQLLHVLVRPHD